MSASGYHHENFSTGGMSQRKLTSESRFTPLKALHSEGERTSKIMMSED